MRVIDKVIAFLVGGLFIFSGLVKLNDPIGLAIKLEEYFEVFAEDFASFFHAFVPFALPLAFIFIIFEIILGVALILNYKMRLTTLLTLLLIVFFTFLTGYSAVFNKVTDCGCFGDAIPLEPWQSFYKDIVLTVFILFLYFRRKYFYPPLGSIISSGIMITSTILCIILGIIAIEHLPFIDFRPYAVGKNIGDQMVPSEPLRYKYIMSKDGEEFEFESYPKDKSYTFVDMELINEDAQPKITDYSVWNDEGEFTQESLEGTKMFYIVHDVKKARLKKINDITSLINALDGKVDQWSLTASDGETFENFRHEYQWATPYYYTDATVLKAMLRSNPGTMLLKDGTVLGKWHINDTPSAEDIEKLLQN